MSERLENFNYNIVAEADTRNPRKYSNFPISTELLATSVPAKGEEPKFELLGPIEKEQYNKKYEIPAKRRFTAEKLKFFLAKEYVTQKAELKEEYNKVYKGSQRKSVTMVDKEYSTSPLAVNIYRLTQDFTGKKHPSGAEVKLIIEGIQTLETYFVGWTDKETNTTIFQKLLTIDQIEYPRNNPNISAIIFHISLYPVFTRRIKSGYSIAKIEVIKKTKKNAQILLYELLLKTPRNRPFTKDKEDLFRQIFSRNTKSHNAGMEKRDFWEAVKLLKEADIIKECKEGEGMLTFYFE